MAVRQIERAVILEPTDIEAVHRLFANKGNSDPVVRAYREALRSIAPSWLSGLNEDTNTVSRSRLDELLTAIDTRRELVNSLPTCDTKTEALAELTSLQDLISEMLAQLDGNAGTGGQ